MMMMMMMVPKCVAHSLSAEEKYSLHPLIAGLSNGSYLDLHEKSCDPVEQGTATWTHWQQQTATASHKPLASVAWFVPEISDFHMPSQSDMKPIEIYLGTQRCILLTQKRGNVVSSANFYKKTFPSQVAIAAWCHHPMITTYKTPNCQGPRSHHKLPAP